MAKAARAGLQRLHDAAVVNAARADALRARAPTPTHTHTHTHTHSLTLPAKAARAGALTCTQAHIHLASRHAFTEHSFILGLGRVAGSKRGSIHIAFLSYYTYYVHCAYSA